MSPLVAGFTDAGVERFALLLGLSLFFGLAFEGFYAARSPHPPGGVRTFPLLALTGGALWLLDQRFGAAFVAGLLVVGSWCFAYVRRQMREPLEPGDGPYIVPLCNVLSYTLGAAALTQPLWICVTVTVAGVLLLSERQVLHALAQRLSDEEIITAGKFLILVGVILPLLHGLPPIPGTTITPFGVWLAVVAVSTISYASYLLQTYVFPGRGTLLMAVLGGLYSSTATTVVLAQRSCDEGVTPELESGIVAATGMMYLRILIVCSVFSLALGKLLAVPMIALCAISLAIAWTRARASEKRTPEPEKPANPLQLTTAFVFALFFVGISILTGVVQKWLGGAGVLGLAAVVGVTDIDPFVLSLAQGGAVQIGLITSAVAIVIAASSNDVLKAIYTIAFARRRESWVPAAMLGVVALLGLAFAFAIARGAFAWAS